MRNIKNDQEFTFQSALFGYLTPEQQIFVRPVLRTLKRWAQDELCCALLDYMETGEESTFDNVMMQCAFCYLTGAGMNDDKRTRNLSVIRPLNNLIINH